MERGKRKGKAGRPSFGKKCPRCGKVGSPQLKAVKNRKGGNEYKYVYYAHPTGPHSVKWCYVGGKKKEDDGRGRGREGDRRRRIRPTAAMVKMRSKSGRKRRRGRSRP